MSNFTAVKELITDNDKKRKKNLMKKIINKQNINNELWFNWLISSLNSYEPFKDFDSGKNPKDVAEDFITHNRESILDLFEGFDDEDKYTLDQFQKLTECEWHVFRILKNQLDSKNKVRFVDFKKGKR